MPGKNVRPFAGRPLFHWVLSALLGCEAIGEVVIDTDSLEIVEDAAHNFPGVRVLPRPVALRGGDVPMNEVILNDVEQLDADYFLQTHATNPLLRGATIAAAVRRFLAEYPRHDSLFSVTRVQKRLWDGLARPINHNPAILLRTQDLPPVYEENSCLYLFPREGLLARRSRIGERPLMLEVDPLEAWDIDDETDFEVAEQLLLRRQGGTEVTA